MLREPKAHNKLVLFGELLLLTCNVSLDLKVTHVKYIRTRSSHAYSPSISPPDINCVN